MAQEAGESDREYGSRVLRSHFSDKFSQAIRDFVGVIFNNGVRLVDVPGEIRQHWVNLDGNGSNGDRLCASLALQSLRRGHSFVLCGQSDQAIKVGNRSPVNPATCRPLFTISFAASFMSTLACLRTSLEGRTVL
ncbi:hypothetical protein [cf. Phormidesmis sp. LEGE 11477]|uniref:hypothetical protein n=1 Tax=cf. Phormidesmis sp. LEGE 11477 TaxID=1828680 RepID=UPI00187F69E8|nr:hypothetical protein [cf. Phormidesmis sp. LEGE 11477]MBE9060546.1 hypothetical protein [cf. Phormidesmis sp. LEGE 11477]